MFVIAITTLAALGFFEEGITQGEPLGIVLGTIFAITTIVLWKEATQ